jgi:hypothetical protein
MLTIEGCGARDVAKRAHETTRQVFRYAIEVVETTNIKLRDEN